MQLTKNAIKVVLPSSTMIIQVKLAYLVQIKLLVATVLMELSQFVDALLATHLTLLMEYAINLVHHPNTMIQPQRLALVVLQEQVVALIQMEDFLFVDVQLDIH